MSTALLRQALAFVDPEETPKGKRSRRGPYPKETRGQGVTNQKHKSRKAVKQISKTEQQVSEENINKLLALSQPTADSAVAKKFIERALTGKPIAEKIEIKTEEEKSILFPEESPKDFEKGLLCD